MTKFLKQVEKENCPMVRWIENWLLFSIVMVSKDLEAFFALPTTETFLLVSSKIANTDHQWEVILSTL